MTARENMARPSLVAIVDDDDLVRSSLAALFRDAGFPVAEFATAEEALAGFRRRLPGLVIADLHLPGAGGLHLLAEIRRMAPRLPVIVITGYGSIETAVEAMKLGARDFVLKPVDDAELLRRAQRALETGRSGDGRPGGADILGRFQLDSLVGQDPAMRRIFEMIEIVAPTRATVIIHGESGTGKTRLARAIHHRSERRDGPFVEVSCGSLPDTLLESELFGYTKGAFTGALSDRVGKFEAAEGGTILLDEIGNASPALQVKLLRVLQDREFERLGSQETRRADVRVILATNADLEAAVREGRFRQDLFYRIHVVVIDVPPLRDRVADIPHLARAFLERHALQHRKAVRQIDDEALALLCRYGWPGNVRELENAIERAVVLAVTDTIGRADLPPKVTGDAAGVPPEGAICSLKSALALPERELILRCLRQHEGHRARTARALGINRSTLFNKMRKYGLFQEAEESSASSS